MKYHHGLQVSVVLLLSQGARHGVHAFAIPTPIIDFAIGGMAGGAGAFAAYPLDYITAQMQTETCKYNNGAECFIETVKEGGPLALYRGAGVQVLGIAPEKAIKLNVNDFIRTLLVSNPCGITVGGEIVAGAIAGLCQVIATSPLETIKVALQTSDKTFDDVMKDIGGIGGLFHGAQACMARDVIFTALLFPIYSHLRMVMPDFFAGSIAGIIATFAATPADVVKTRILSQETSTKPLPIGPTQRMFEVWTDVPDMSAFTMGWSSSRPRTVSATAMSATSRNTWEPDEPQRLDRNPFVVGCKIAEKEGPMVLLSGVSERCIGSIPRFGLTLALYDVLKTMVVETQVV